MALEACHSSRNIPGHMTVVLTTVAAASTCGVGEPESSQTGNVVTEVSTISAPDVKFVEG